MTLRQQLAILLLLIFLLAFRDPAQSQDANFGFEDGTIANWSASNATSGVKNTWSSSGSGVQVTTGVTNYSPGGGLTWSITPYGSYMTSIQPGAGSVTFDQAITSLGLTGVENTAIKNYLSYQSSNGGGGNPTPTDASWIKRSVNLQAGVTYSFAWNYLSTDYTPWNDGSMISLTHATDANVTPTLNNSQQRYGLLGFTNPGTGEYATGSYGSTGWQVAVFTVPVDGEYVLGFASFNLGDTALSPILFIDEIQGLTTKNGQDFGPVAPNPGSTAPTTPSAPPEPTYSSNITVPQQGRVNQRLNRPGSGSGVYIDQVGTGNTVSITQSGNRNNYIKHQEAGNLNSTTIVQSATANTGDGQYIEHTVNGNSNTVNLQQSGSPGKRMFVAPGSSNSVTVNQKDGGDHYLDLSMTGTGHAATVLQEGSAQHRATIATSNAGGASNISVNQSGATGRVFNVEQTCVSAGGCGVSITQNQ